MEQTYNLQNCFSNGLFEFEIECRTDGKWKTGPSDNYLPVVVVVVDKKSLDVDL